MKREVRICIVLMISRRNCVEQDASCAGAPAVLDFESIKIKEAEHVIPRGLPVHLYSGVFELRPIDQRSRPADQADVLNRVRAVEPCMIPPDRTAELGPIVRHLLVVIGLGVSYALSCKLA